ncbi:DUF1016 N-terminal domain-containing protein [Legionella pneumophila]|nr:DUF1016 N-terminal domain-containing protein [Legionella pneumophila]
MSLSATPELLTAIRTVLNEARTQLQKTVNSTMVQVYWNVGRLIVEHEQQGEKRAAYGQYQLKHLGEQLQAEFGKGFYERNLRIMRAFYLAYPIWSAVQSELSWTHIVFCYVLRMKLHVIGIYKKVLIIAGALEL